MCLLHYIKHTQITNIFQVIIRLIENTECINSIILFFTVYKLRRNFPEKFFEHLLRITANIIYSYLLKMYLDSKSTKKLYNVWLLDMTILNLRI